MGLGSETANGCSPMIAFFGAEHCHDPARLGRQLLTLSQELQRVQEAQWGRCPRSRPAARCGARGAAWGKRPRCHLPPR